MNKIGTEIFIVKNHETNPLNRISIVSLVNFLQEAAWNNAKKLGFSVHDLHEQGVTWVLHRMKLKVEKLPSYGDEVKVETWPSGKEKYYVYRDFRIYLNGSKIGEAASNWLVFDLNKRRMISTPDFITENVPVVDNDNLEPPKDKIIFPGPVQYSSSFRVEWHHLDLNRHTNHSYYFQWLVESLPLQHIDTRELREVDIIFKTESEYNDQLNVYSTHTADGWFYHKILNAINGKEVVLAKTLWE